MKKIILLTAMLLLNILMLSLTLITCSSYQADLNEQESIDRIIPQGNEKYLNNDSDYIFDQEKLHTFELQLPEKNLMLIDSDPAAEKYVEGRLIFEGETISPVGIRYKGQIGAFVNCLSCNDWNNPGGYKTCTKLSMKIKINWDDPDTKFYGLKKLLFHSQNQDPTQMHERLGYWLFREMGVPAPRSVHARLIINGEYCGVYALTECIDGRFTRYNFDNGKGNLYKEIWPVNMNGDPFPEYRYLEALRTNEDENPSAELIKSFGEDISDSTPENIQNIIHKWTDIDSAIAFAVVDRAIRNDDGPFHWYCDGRYCGNHNYFWYEEPSEQRLYLIPWDLDNAFENLVRDANPVTPIADEWGEITAECEPFRYGLFQWEQRSAACDKLTSGWTGYKNLYNAKVGDFLEGPFSQESINSRLDTWTKQIYEATAEADRVHLDALSEFEWNMSLDVLRAGLAEVREKLKAYIQ
jgi:spore coat protein CotH